MNEENKEEKNEIINENNSNEKFRFVEEQEINELTLNDSSNEDKIDTNKENSDSIKEINTNNANNSKEEKEPLNKDDKKGKTRKNLIIISAIPIILSLLLKLNASRITEVASKYPKVGSNDLGIKDPSIGMTFCDYISKNTQPYGELFILILLTYFILILIAGIKKIKRTNIIFILGIIVSSILCYSAAYDTFRCSLDDTWKPILYLYPEKEENVTVKLEREDLLMTTYPKYNNGWDVIAYPDGSLYDSNNNYYYALYWDEKKLNPCEFEDGFYVEDKDAIKFLEEKLTIIGLSPKERNEFIMYWLPVLEQNKKNLVQFDLTEEIEKDGKLIITPKPDSMLRVHINIKKVDKKTNIKEQELTTFERFGFTAVEWGGTLY